MTKLWTRLFAGFFALLFLASASAFTIALIANGISNRHKPKDTATSQQQTQSAATCPENSVSGIIEVTPAVYKPTASVTKVQATDLTPGSGTAVKSGDCLQVKYYGTLAKDGTVFDENFDKNTDFQFIIGQGQVIKGWDTGLIGAQVGTVRRLVIPSADAYGSSGQGSIPPNADLVFVVKVLSIK